MSSHSSPKIRWFTAAALVVAAGLGLRAEFPEWVKNVETTGRFHDALYRLVPTPSGPIEIRRTPADARTELTRAVGNATGADLLSLRARLSEEQLDTASAERDWRAYAAAASDAAAGQLALADFYHRRVQVPQEVEALSAAARAADPPADRLRAVASRRSWRTFERILTLVSEQRLPDAVAERELRAWIERYPTEPPPYRRLLAMLVAQRRAADVETLLAQYQRAFPGDETVAIDTRANLALANGRAGDALGLYDQAFQPLWSDSLVQAYFALLTSTHNLRAFLDRARADVLARPDDLAPVARIYYYYRQSGNVTAAEQALADYEARRERATRSASELLTLARLYERSRNSNEALRYYASVYRLPGATDSDVETALASIIDTLFASPEQPLRFGSGDLSFYRDIATLDRGPGLLNGVWSLLFNSESPEGRFSEEEAQAAPYFRRARAAELLATFDTRFPASTRRAELNAALVSTFAAYGESDAVIERGRRFLTTFADAPQRAGVSLMMADAFALKNQTGEEFAIYNALLEELATRADHVPIGSAESASPEANVDRSTERGARDAGARSPEYARVLDRYIARLVANQQLNAAFAVYRQEIERNPDDQGLYAATAQFLEQNNFTAGVEQLYRQVIQQFPDRSWHHRLARWYLRQRRAADFAALTRDVTRTFDGTDLSSYFDEVVSNGSLTGQVYLQLNLAAKERFPHQLIFVRNLLSAYSTPATADPAAYETLLRQHWFEDEQLADQWFARLSSANRLETEMAAVRGLVPAIGNDWNRLARENPLSARFLAEGEIWRSRFEAGSAVLTAVSNEFPAERELGRRVGSLHRSLASVDARQVDTAATAVRRLLQADPRDGATLIMLGEIYADHEQYDRARGEWDRLPAIQPGVAGGYLDAATVFWDYYQYDDALRTIARARDTFADRALFAYEAGAIHEGLRQPELAIDEYFRGAVLGDEAAPARGRLLTLARRERYRAAVDRASLAAVDGPAPTSTAVTLRIAVLETQNRRSDLEQFLASLIGRTTSLELMTEVASAAERLGLEAVRTRSLERQIEVMSDPIDKLQLRNALVRLYESRDQFDLARRTLEAIYTEHPSVLGIVRSTADYYWRHKLERESIDVLTRAAAAAYPALRLQFIVEAAQKSNQSGNYVQARQLLTPLLASDPFNTDYLATVAQSYALAKQDIPLRDFYKTTIEAMRSAPLATEERTRRIAGLRRGLIPALERLQDHAGAVDQFIEILNRYPDDAALLQEAGRYARLHSRTDQLVAYYTKTAADSPRDYRWPMLLAMLDTQFENYPAAIDAYAKASAIRPDRTDFYLARAGLEERLMRFDDAVASYEKTYELSYHAPDWMLKIAELRARQGRIEDVTRALRAALIDGRPEGPDPYFSVAEKLDGWNMLEAALPFVEAGVQRAGADGLLRTGAIYVTVNTRLRRATDVFDRLLAARAQARPTENNSTAWAANALQERVTLLGDIIARDLSPEEKTAFARFLDGKKAQAPRADVEATLLPLAQHAQLTDRVAAWQAELMMAERDSDSSHYRSQYIALQTSRGQFEELGQALEPLARPITQRRYGIALEAADAYRKAGNADGELRLLSTVPAASLSGSSEDRFFTLLLQRDPNRLIGLAATGGATLRTAAANFVVSHGTADQALAAVRARGRGMPVVWNNAYAALVGMYFGRFDSTTTAAFKSLLGDSIVSERMKPVDRATALAGDAWFAYGSRYGEYLAFAKQADGDGYLSAELEHTAAKSDAFVALADFYRDQGILASALGEYDRAATLNVRRSDIHLRAAAILWRQTRRADAIARWKQAMELLVAPTGRSAADSAPLVAALDSIGGRQLLSELRDPADRMVRAYVARNGGYRADALFRSAFRAANNPQAGTDWLIDLLRAAPNQADVLGAVAKATWLPDARRDQLFQRVETVAAEAVAASQGRAQQIAQTALDRWKIERIRSLIETRQMLLAAPLLNALPATLFFADRTAFEARIAVATATFDAWLDGYARDQMVDEKLDALRNAATALRRNGETASARRLMEFVYTRQLGQEPVAPSVLLGLAEIRLEQQNVAAAIDLLQRLTVVVGQPFEHLGDAATLLERLNHPAQALEFRRARAQAVPWDATAAIALARTEAAAGPQRTDAWARLARIADDTRERYSVRVTAARTFATIGGRLDRPATTEIDWLRAPAALTPESASRPMFVAARLVASQQTTDLATRARLLREAVAISPEDLSLRVPLFRAELSIGRPAQAIEAIQPTVRRSRSLNGLGLTVADRSRLARDLGDAYARVDRLADAVRFFTIALEGQTRVARAPLQQRMTSLNAEISRQARNTARQPRVAAGIDQPQLVRPRIPPPALAAAAAPAANVPNGNAVQGGAR